MKSLPTFVFEKREKAGLKVGKDIFKPFYFCSLPTFSGFLPTFEKKAGKKKSALKPLFKGFVKMKKPFCPLSHFFLLFNVIKNISIYI